MSALPLAPTGAARLHFGSGKGVASETDALLVGLGHRLRDLGLEPGALALAWQITNLAGGLEPADFRHLLLLLVAVLLAEERGHTRLDLDGDGPAALETLLAAVGLRDATDAVRALALSGRAQGAIGARGDRRPLVLAQRHVGSERLARLEDTLARGLAARLRTVSAEPEEARTRALEEVLRHTPRRDNGTAVILNEEQERAVTQALRGSFTVVTGGPGTGKTSLVVALLRAAARLGIAPETMALAAPTGKAAQRLDDAVRAALRRIPKTGAKPQLNLFARAPVSVDERLLTELPKPETLHRLLGYSPADGRFRTHERAPLAAKLVVVDEGSMMDSELLDRVVRAVPKDARLVVLGDADQLPSIEAGAVFRDLVRVGEAKGFCVRLERSYRMNPDDPAGASIYQAAQAFRGGRMPSLPRARPVENDEAAFAFRGMEALEGSPTQLLAPFTRAWFEAHLRGGTDHRARIEHAYEWSPGEAFAAEESLAIRELLRHYETARVLTFTRDDGRVTSSKSLNGIFSDLLGAAHDPRSSAGAFVPGTPIMMLRNDYERGLFNGDQGIVLRRGKGRGLGLVAVFPRGEALVGFPLDGLAGDVVPAFAMTVHKSQGSEYAHVGLVLPEDDGPLVTRELLYTAVTRASRSVTIVGSEALLAAAIARPAARSTGLGGALEEALG